MSNLNVRRQDLPPAAPEILWVERPMGGEKHRLTVYSNALWGVWTHWCGKPTGTKPCYEDHTLCHNGHEEDTLRWRGYLHGWSQQRGKQIFMQLTPAACRQLLEQLPEGPSLRGLTLEVIKTKSDKGRLNCHVVQYVTRNTADLPKEMDPLKSLFALWKVVPSSMLLHRKLAMTIDDVPLDGFGSRVA